MAIVSGPPKDIRSPLDRFVDQFVFFKFWFRLNDRLAAWTPTHQWLTLILFSFAALVSRLWAANHVSSYDFQSYVVVSDVVLDGGNPYETGRYKYAPTWFLALAAIRTVAHDPQAFKIALVILLTATDIGIAYLLMRHGYLAASGLFLLTPVTIAITGQHIQFDNVAVLLALLATMVIPKVRKGPLIRHDFYTVLLLGASLSVKHIFIVFPLWLAMRQGSVKRAFFYACTPLVVFILTLVPPWLANGEAVVESVFRYRSSDNAPFFRAVLPDEVVWGLTNRGLAAFLFLAILVAVGLAYRRLPAFETGLVYAVSLVVFSSAVVDQYLPIPMAGIAVFFNIGLLYWLAIGSAHLFGNPDTLHVPLFTELRTHIAPYPDVVFQDLLFPLLLGWLLMTIWIFRRKAECGLISSDTGTCSPRLDVEQPRF